MKQHHPTTAGTTLGGIIALPRSVLFRVVVSAEVGVLYHLQRARGRLPRWLRHVCDRLLSAHPLYDLTLGLWLLVPLALYHLGWRLFWPLSLNVLVGFLLSWGVGGPIPRDMIEWLRPRPRLSPSGFPCIEVQVAACLLTYVGWWYGTPLAVGGCTAAFLALIALRLYALTHFPHQLALSAALGAASVPGCRRLGRYLFPLPVAVEVHFLGAFMIACLFIGYIAYHAESNDVPFMRIPRETCAYVCRYWFSLAVCFFSPSDYLLGLRRCLPLTHPTQHFFPPHAVDENVLTGILAQSDRASTRDNRATRSVGESSASSSVSGVERGRRTYPPMGGGGGGGGGGGPPSYPPAGPPPNREPGRGRGLNLVGGASAQSSYRGSGSEGGGGERVPRDSLFHLLNNKGRKG